MIRKIKFAPGEWYHCYNRGVDKRIIFKSGVDYRRFVMLLYASNSTDPVLLSNLGKNSGGPSLRILTEKIARNNLLVDVGAYALMPNHFHLLLREREQNAITTFMRKLSTAYVMSFNLRYQRVGTLFSSRFQAQHVNNDRYMRRLVNYIHANPAELFEPGFKQGIITDMKLLEAQLGTYKYSSFPDYQAHGIERLERIVLNQKALRDATDVDLSFSRLFEDAIDFAREESL